MELIPELNKLKQLPETASSLKKLLSASESLAE
jgi:hypothetical protein